MKLPGIPCNTAVKNNYLVFRTGCRSGKVVVVEDNPCSWGGRAAGRPAGGSGDCHYLCDSLMGLWLQIGWGCLWPQAQSLGHGNNPSSVTLDFSMGFGFHQSRPR